MSWVVFTLIAFLCSSTLTAEIGVAQLEGTAYDPFITGQVYFVTINSTLVYVWANVSYITNNVGNLHGMHVHTFGDLTSPVASNVESHFIGELGVNVHACENSSIRHEGDMGNWQVSENGTIVEEKYLDLLSLSGDFSIIGRAVVLHNFTDDCNSTGSSLARLAQGVIGIANPNNLPAAVAAVAAFANSVTNTASAGSESIFTKAIVNLSPINSYVSGVVTFYQNNTGLTVQAALQGLSNTSGHGFHIHLFGDLNSEDGSAGGRHFNTSYDLGNICTFGSDGTAYYNYHFDGLLNGEGLAALAGRSVIVHAFWDPIGMDDGIMIAQGVVGIANNISAAVTFPENLVFNSPDCQLYSPEVEITVARVVGDQFDPSILGFVYFLRLNETHVFVYANISGITSNPDSPHALHVHSLGDITSPTGAFVEGHYVGSGQSEHACENSYYRHEGDMGFWTVTGGVLQQSKILNLLALAGEYSIVGRSVVLHNLTDDCTNVNNGNAGNRLAQGVIGIANPGLSTIPQGVISFLGLNSSSTSNYAVAGPGVTKVIASISSTFGSNVSGIVTFEQQDEEVTVLAKIFGLNSTQAYGFHIHIFGDMSKDDGTSASTHYNPTNTPHALPPSPRHVGDLGNICTFDQDGTAYYWFIFTSFLNLTGTNSIVGRSIIIHSLRDNGGSSYGDRIGQGVIGLGSTSTNITIPQGLSINTPTCPVPSTTSPSPSTSSSTSATSSNPLPTPTPSNGHGISAGAKALIAIIVILFVVGIIGVFLYYQKREFILQLFNKDKKKKGPGGDYVAFEDNEAANW